MNTIVLQEPGRFEATDTQAPGPPAPGCATVQVRRIGICGTDIHAYYGRQPFFTYPRILGHELGVEVLEVNGDTAIRPGDRCAVEPYLSCGTCVACRQGKTNCCVRLQVLGVHTDGGMRERIDVPLNKLHPSSRLSLDQLALVEMLGIGAHAVDRAQVRPGEIALVIGAGPIGLAVTQFARQAGARVIAMDVKPERLAFSRERMGSEFTVAAGDEALAAIEQITAGDLPTLVFDATGNSDSMQTAFEYVAHGGRLVFVGLFQGDVTFHDPHLHRREITLLASRNSTGADFRRIIGLMEQGAIDTTPWITHRVPFTDAATRLPTWLEPDSGLLKGVIELNDSR